MIRLKPTARIIAALSAVLLQQGSATQAQGLPRACQPARVIPLTGPEPPAQLIVEAPLPEPLSSRGVAVIPYCAENMRIVPVFGAGALDASPRVGHIHVIVDDSPWLWADASGTPVILQGLAPGSHKVRLDLVNANHQVVDTGTVRFEVPARSQ